MPAGRTKLIPYLVHEVDKPVVASGLIQDKEDVMGALKAGAMAVSSTNRKVWDCSRAEDLQLCRIGRDYESRHRVFGLLCK